MKHEKGELSSSAGRRVLQFTSTKAQLNNHLFSTEFQIYKM